MNYNQAIAKIKKSKNENEILKIILSFKDDNIKESLLGFLTVPADKVTVISSMLLDSLKMRHLEDKSFDFGDVINIIKSFSSDTLKTKVVRAKKIDYGIMEIALSMSCIDEKIKLLSLIREWEEREMVINSISNGDTRDTLKQREEYLRTAEELASLKCVTAIKTNLRRGRSSMDR